MLMQTHSALSIRLGQASESVVDVPMGLAITVPIMGGRSDVINVVSKIIPGEYTVKDWPLGFRKERGDLVIGTTIYHVELISVITSDSISHAPMIVRLWNQHTGAGFEYLVSTGIVNFRYAFASIVANVNTRSVMSVLTSHLMVSALSIDSTQPPIRYLAACGLTQASHFVPNLTSDQYGSRWIMVGEPDPVGAPNIGINNTLDMMLEALFEEGLSCDNLNQFIGILEGHIPHSVRDSFTHPGTFTDIGSGRRYWSIDGQKHYDAVLTLTRVPFDHFEWEIDVSTGVTGINMTGLDSMAGFHLPFSYQGMYHIINHICAEFMHKYFQAVSTDTGVVRHIDIMNHQSFVVDQVHITRTMDEYLTVTIHSGGVVYQRCYDLIIMSVLSPAIPI